MTKKTVTVKKAGTFIGVGLVTTGTDYLIYTLFMMLVLGGDLEKTWLAGLVAGIVSVSLAYVLHNNITWKERDPGKYGAIKFLGWNAFAIGLLRTILLQVFASATWIYDWAYGVAKWIHLPFERDFIESTGIYVLTTIVITIMNFMIYEKLIFNGEIDSHKADSAKEIDMKGVGQPGEEK